MRHWSEGLSKGLTFATVDQSVQCLLWHKVVVRELTVKVRFCRSIGHCKLEAGPSWTPIKCAGPVQLRR